MSAPSHLPAPSPRLRSFGDPRTAALSVSLRVLLVLGLMLPAAVGQEEAATPAGRSLTVELERQLYYFDETLRGEVGGLIPAERIRIDHLDAFGRVIERLQERKGSGATVSFSLRLNRPFTTLHRIVVTGEGGARGQARFVLAPRENTWERYHVIWTGRLDPDALEPLLALRLAGVTAVVAREPAEVEAALTQDFRLLLAFDASSEEPVAGPGFDDADAEKVAQEYVRTKDVDLLRRTRSLDDPQAVGRWTETLLGTVRAYSHYAPLGYSLGSRLWVSDPEKPLDVGFGPESLAAFREWLGERYASVRALNSEWDVNFTSWSQVLPMAAPVLLAREGAKGEGEQLAFGPWLEHRRYQDARFAELVAGLWNTAYREQDTSRVGFGGFASAEAYGGYDASLLPAAVGWIARREGVASAELLQGFNQRLAVPTAAVAEVPLGPGASWQVWSSLLSGDRGAILMAGEEAPTAQDLEELLPVLLELDAGVGSLLTRGDCRLTTDPVALVYSQESIEAMWLLDALALGREWADAAQHDNSTWHRNFTAWLELLSDVGLHPAIVSAAEIGTPAFQDARYRVLILPKTVALADDRVEPIRQFVERGGLLIADSQCGLLNQHGRERRRALLDDLFGITRRDRRSGDARGRYTSLVSEPAQKHPPLDKLAVLALRLGSQTFQPVEPAVRKDVAQPMLTFGETAALLGRTHGREGSSLYLNCSLLDYPTMRTQPKGADLQQLVRNVLRVAGVEPRVRVLSSQTGQDVPLVATRLFQKDGLEYLGILYPYGSILPPGLAEQEVELRLLERPYVYDVRAGEFLTRTESLEVALKPYEPRVLALLPYKLEGVALVDEGVSGRDLTCRVELSLRDEEGRPGQDHLVRLELLGPDEQRRPNYTTLVVVPGGQLLVRTRIGLEEPAGEWTLRAVDVATGLSGEVTFALEPGE